MNFSQERYRPHQEQIPHQVDLFDPDLEMKIRREGQIYLRKIEPIKEVEQVTVEQALQTILPDGTIESTVNAKIGDWIITGSKGEKFVFTTEKFESLYDKNAKGEYIPKKRKIVALKNPYNEPIRITAPWSTTQKQEYQNGSEDAMLVLSLDEYNQTTKDRYLIGDEEMLLSNYKRSLERFRHVDGKDEAVVEIGSQEQLATLLSIFKNPEQYSREEFLEAIMNSYSGDAYGDAHFKKEYEEWGGPRDGEMTTTTYGEFRKEYPYLSQLSLDSGFMYHLPEFMELIKDHGKFSDYKEARKALAEKLGNREVYRGMMLSEDEVIGIKEKGIYSSIARSIKNSAVSPKDDFEGKIISIGTDDMFDHHIINGHPDTSTFISVSPNEYMAGSLGEVFGKNKDGLKKNYVVKMNLPVIELIHAKANHRLQPHPDVQEHLVFWKINPGEIIEIKEFAPED